jgi:hypothetical protein
MSRTNLFLLLALVVAMASAMEEVDSSSMDMFPADELLVQVASSAKSPESDLIDGANFVQLSEEQRPTVLQSLEASISRLNENPHVPAEVSQRFENAFVELKAKSKAGYAQAKGIMASIKEMKAEITARGERDVAYMKQTRETCTENQARITSVITSLEARKKENETKLAEARETQAKLQKELAEAKAKAPVLQQAMMKTDEENMTAFMKYATHRSKRDLDIDILYDGLNPVCKVSKAANSAECLKLGLDRQSYYEHRDQPLPQWETMNQAMDTYMQDKSVAAKLSKMFGDEMASSDVPPPGPVMDDESLVKMEAAPAPGDAVYKATSDKLRSLLNSEKDAITPVLKKTIELHEQVVATCKEEADAYAVESKKFETKAVDFLHQSVVNWRKIEETEGKIAEVGAVISRLVRVIFKINVAIKKQQLSLAMEKLRCWREEQSYLVRVARRKKENDELTELQSLIRTLEDSKLPKCPKDCTSLKHGQCYWQGEMGTTSYCVCTDTYTGEDCSQFKCPGVSTLPSGTVSAEASVELDNEDAEVKKNLNTETASTEFKYYAATEKTLTCSGRGTCDSGKGSCACATGFFGTACEKKKCPGDGTCGGFENGHCNDKLGLCVCTRAFFGDTCTKKKCLGVGDNLFPGDSSNACHGRGACQTDGTCKCDAGFTGRSCKDRTCPGDCSSKGVCDARSGKCTCNTGFAGEDCSKRTCPGDCSGHGLCDDRVGKCVCHVGYTGQSCVPARACNVTKANWVLSFDKKGWSYCPSNMAMRGLWKNTCEGIYCLEFASCASACEGQGTPLVLTGCYNQDHWATSFNEPGISQCRTDTFMVGLWRGDCQLLYCIELARCCQFKGAVWSGCRTRSWNADGSGWLMAATDHFMVGIRRNGSIKVRSENMLRNIDGVQECRFQVPNLQKQ